MFGGQVNVISQLTFSGRSHCWEVGLKCNPFWHACWLARPLMQRINPVHEPSTRVLSMGAVAEHRKQVTSDAQSHALVAGLNSQSFGHVPEVNLGLTSHTFYQWSKFLPGTGPFGVHRNQALHWDTSGMNVLFGTPSQIVTSFAYAALNTANAKPMITKEFWELSPGYDVGYPATYTSFSFDEVIMYPSFVVLTFLPKKT